MRPLFWFAKAKVALLLWLAAFADAQQQGDIHIGYVYPAGGKQGSSFEAVIAGQRLTNISNVYVSGGGVQASITGLIQPISGGELNKLRIKADELMQKRAVARNDMRALEAFRSFRNAKDNKDGKSAAGVDDDEIAAMKKKFANATWTSEDEKLLAEIRRKMSSGVRRPANPAICELTVVQFTVDANAEPGQRELRVATPNGLSNPLVFNVGQLAEFSEKPIKTISEQKSSISKTVVVRKSQKTEPEMKIMLPAVVNGQIMPGEIDRCRFTASKGQRLVIAASVRQLIPYIPDAVPGWFQATLALYDAQGKELAYDDDFRFNPDPVLYYQIPADGEYVVEIKDAIYRGREDFVYRITIGELPFVTGVFPLGGPAGERSKVELKGWNLPKATLTIDDKHKAPGVYPFAVTKNDLASNFVPFAVDALPECAEKEPNDQQAGAQQVSTPVIVNGRIGQPDDSDQFCFEGRAGEQIVAEVYARRLNSPMDSLLVLSDASGRQVAINDDHEDKGSGLVTHHADSRISATLPAAGKYYVRVTDAQHKGGPDYSYRLRISQPRPDFELRVVPSSISARTGTTSQLTVVALRKDGFAGDIDLALKDAPSGFSLGGARIPAGQDQVRVTLAIPSKPLDAPVDLKLEGRAKIDGNRVAHPVVPAENMMQAFEYRHLVPSQELKVAVMGKYTTKGIGSVKVSGDLPVKIPAGGTGRVQYGFPSSVLSKADLVLVDPPEGITIKSVEPASRDRTEIILQTDAEKVKPGLKGNLIVGVTAGKSSPSSSKKGAPQGMKKPMYILPAIPFEITGI